MKKPTTYSLLLLAFAAFVFHGCQEDADVSYNPEVKEIIDNYCITCHGSVAPSANLDLSTYTNVRNSAEMGNLIDRMNSSSNPMPPSGRISSSERNVIDDWASNGFPEN